VGFDDGNQQLQALSLCSARSSRRLFGDFFRGWAMDFECQAVIL